MKLYNPNPIVSLLPVTAIILVIALSIGAAIHKGQAQERLAAEHKACAQSGGTFVMVGANPVVAVCKKDAK